MAQYIVTIATNWYTANGSVGNSPTRKLPVGYVFESIQEANGRRNVMNTNMWVPVSACKLNAVTPPPDPDPTGPPDTFPPYIPVGAEWQMRFKLTPSGEYTELYTFVRKS